MTAARAWLHWCGALNKGDWEPGAVCTGCRSEVRTNDVSVGDYEVTRYRLERIGRHEEAR